MFKREIYSFSLTILGIFLIGSLPYLLFNYDRLLKILVLIDQQKIDNANFLYDNFTLNFSSYLHHIVHTLTNMTNLGNLEYYEKGAYLPLFPEFLHLYLKSFLFLVSALALGILAGILIVYLTMLLGGRSKKGIKSILLVVESLPDIFVILLFQLLIMWFFKHTNLRLLNIYSSYGDPAYALPIICLSVLPAVYITKYLLLTFEDEEKKDYVVFARSKGISFSAIIISHIFKNSIITFFNHFKSIFWFALSNLLMLEFIFNLRGFTTFVQSIAIRNPDIITYSLLMVFIPFYFSSLPVKF